MFAAGVAILPPVLPIHVALVAAALGAIDGAYGVVDPAASARLAGVSILDEPARDAMRAQAAARFLCHAVVLAALWRAPSVGACFAAAVGSAWLGSAAVRAVMVMRRRTPLDLVRVLGATGLGLAMWWPLWIYLLMLRMLAERGAAA